MDTALVTQPVPPRTMTMAGLRFLTALSRQRRSGAFLEIGPLFGSSTHAIAAGRDDASVPIYTIDTFDPAPWVRRRLGIDLSRNAFDRFTASIENLSVLEGMSPDIAKGRWDAPIGFYFDDATHGDPGWSANYRFFEPFFTEDAIICGDDFACGWPDIIRNVYDIVDREGVKLFVIGRVWAFSRMEETRITSAIHEAFPTMAQYSWQVSHEGQSRTNIAASWSWGLHKDTPMQSAQLLSSSNATFLLKVEYTNGDTQTIDVTQQPMKLAGLKSVLFDMPDGLGVQFCILRNTGRTENSKSMRNGSKLSLEPQEYVTSIRLSDH